MIGAVLSSPPGQQAEAVRSRRRTAKLGRQPIARYTDRMPGKEHRGFKPVAIEEREAMLSRAPIMIGQHFTASGRDRYEKLVKGRRFAEPGAFQAKAVFGRRQ